MTKIPHTGPRIETGPIQFGDDWPGVFIRGDNALYFAEQLRVILSRANDYKFDLIAKATLEALLSDLGSCDIRLLKQS
jgi:hypothetical protein